MVLRPPVDDWGLNIDRIIENMMPKEAKFIVRG